MVPSDTAKFSLTPSGTLPGVNKETSSAEASEAATATESTGNPASSSDNPAKNNKDSPEGNNDTASDDNDDALHLEEDDESPLPKKKTRFVLDEAEDENDNDKGTNDQVDDVLAKSGDAETDKDNEMRNDVADDEDDFDNAMDDDDDAPYNSYASGGARQQVVNFPEPQPAFAPSSTPLDLARRFLCWNHIGSATLVQSDTGRSSVDVHFTDSAFRRPVGFTDTLGFILGSLGEDGGIFAMDLQDDEEDDVLDDDNNDMVAGLSATTKAAVKRGQRGRKDKSNKPTGSTVYFHRFETFGALRDKDWYVTLPDGERVLGCATGEGWAAVMTR